MKTARERRLEETYEVVEMGVLGHEVGQRQDGAHKGNRHRREYEFDCDYKNIK